MERFQKTSPLAIYVNSANSDIMKRKLSYSRGYTSKAFGRINLEDCGKEGVNWYNNLQYGTDASRENKGLLRSP